MERYLDTPLLKEVRYACFPDVSLILFMVLLDFINDSRKGGVLFLFLQQRKLL